MRKRKREKKVQNFQYLSFASRQSFSLSLSLILSLKNCDKKGESTNDVIEMKIADLEKKNKERERNKHKKRENFSLESERQTGSVLTCTLGQMHSFNKSMDKNEK